MAAIDDAVRALLDVAAGRRNLTEDEAGQLAAGLDAAAAADETSPGDAADAAPEPGPGDGAGVED